MKKFIAIVILALCMIPMLCGCVLEDEADIVNHNISKEADNFGCMRRITVYNARTDTIIFQAEGLMSLDNNLSSELVVTFKVGDSSYKKNYVFLNDYTLYVVEDITGTVADKYHYKFYFNPKAVIPDVELR